VFRRRSFDIEKEMMRWDRSLDNLDFFNRSQKLAMVVGHSKSQCSPFKFVAMLLPGLASMPFRLKSTFIKSTCVPFPVDFRSKSKSLISAADILISEIARISCGQYLSENSISTMK
jgi:hypothetical protein